MHLCPQIRMNVQRKLMLAQLSHHMSILLVHTTVIVRLVGEIEVHTPASMLTSAYTKSYTSYRDYYYILNKISRF